MNATDVIDTNEISRLKTGTSTIRMIQIDGKQEVQRYRDQQWEPLTVKDVGVLFFDSRAKRWLIEHCEALVAEYEEGKAEVEQKAKVEQTRRANEWRQIADFKQGKLEVRVLEFKAAPGRKVQLSHKDRWQDCTQQEIQAIRSIAPINNLLIQHFDSFAN